MKHVVPPIGTPPAGPAGRHPFFADELFVQEILFGLFAEGATPQDERMFEKIAVRVSEIASAYGAAAAGRALAQTIGAIMSEEPRYDA
jgi:hypothetical protein